MQIWKITRENMDELAEKVAAALLKGKVVALPTDTVYIPAADATSKKAVEKVFLIKGREKGKPLPIFVKDIAMAKKFAYVLLRQEKLLKKFWPGKATLILKSKGKLPKETGTEENIGLRIPKNEFVQALLDIFKKPIVGTSANLAGKPSILDSKDIKKQFEKRKYKPDILVDAGKLSRSRPSTVIDITKEKSKVLRK